MRDRTTYPGIPAELNGYVRTEYAGDGAEVRRMLVEAAAATQTTNRRRSFLSALFDALGAALPRPGGA